MSTGVSEATTATQASGGTGIVFISKWVNERFPPWDQVLTTHDVARLTRRHRWVLSALTFLGYFPKKQQFHGRKLGWGRHDVERWLERSRPSGVHVHRRSRREHGLSSATPLQMCLLCRCPHRGGSGGLRPACVARCRRTTRHHLR
jgi:hypothetical protein